MSLTRTSLLVGLALFAVACESPADSGRDMSGVCNTGGLESSTVITPGSSSAAQPDFTGGPITDGTYTLASQTLYVSPDAGTPLPGDAVSFSELLVVSSGTVQTTTASNGTVRGAIGTYQTSGSALTISYTCPVIQSVELEYTATSTSLTFGVAQGDGTEVQVFAKQ